METNNNFKLSASDELDRRNQRTQLVLGGLAAAAALGQAVFRPKWTRSEVLGIIVVPVLRTAFEEWQLRKRARVEIPGDSAIVRAYDAAYATSGLEKKPELVVLEDDGVNAMALGTLAPARVAVLGDIDRKLDEKEMEAVFAHELAHVASRDPWLLCAITVATSAVQKTLIAPAIQLVARRNPVVGMVAGFVVQGVFMKLVVEYMRNREAAADARAAMTTGHPEELARALVTLGATQERKVKGWRRLIPDTHPRGWKRVATLMRMGA